MVTGSAKPSAGITASAVIALLGSVIAILFGGLMALSGLAMTRDLLRARNVGDDLEAFAGLRHPLQAEHFNRGRGAGFGHLFTAIVEHGADFAEDLSDDEWIANMQRTLLN